MRLLAIGMGFGIVIGVEAAVIFGCLWLDHWHYQTEGRTDPHRTEYAKRNTVSGTVKTGGCP